MSQNYRGNRCGVLRRVAFGLDDLHRNGQNRIELDLTQVSYRDSTGIGVLTAHAGERGALG